MIIRLNMIVGFVIVYQICILIIQMILSLGFICFTIHLVCQTQKLDSRVIPSELANTLSQMENHALQFLSACPKTDRVEKWISQYLRKEREYIMPQPVSIKKDVQDKSWTPALC